MRIIPDCYDLTVNVGTMAYFFLQCETGISNDKNLIVNASKDAQTAVLKIGVKPRAYDNPDEDDLTVFNLDRKKIEFSDNGFSRHVCHAIRELGVDALLYVYLVYIYICSIM